MKKYLKDKKKLILMLYMAVCVLRLMVRIAAPGEYRVERITYGSETEKGYAITKETVLTAEFPAVYDELSGIGLYYFSNNNTYVDEKINVDFYVEGEKAASSDIELSKQTDKTQIFVPFRQKNVKGKKIGIKIYGTNLPSIEENCPMIGISDTYSWAGEFKVNGQRKSEYLTMGAYFRVVPATDYAVYLECFIEILAGILVYALLVSKCIEMPEIALCGKKHKECCVFRKWIRKAMWGFKRLWQKKKLLVGYIVLILGMLALLEYSYYFGISEHANKGSAVSINEDDGKEEYFLLEKGSVLKQSFKSTEENLGGLGFILNIKESEEEGNISFKIEQEGTGKPIFENVYNLSEVLDKDESGEADGYIYLEFPQILCQSRGVNYTIFLEQESEAQSDLRILLTEKGGMAKGGINDGNATFNIFMQGYYKENLFMKKMYALLSVFLMLMMTIVYFLCFVMQVKCEKIFLPLVFCLGVIYCILIPVYGVLDEPSHVDTAYRVSNEIMGIEDTDSPYTLYKRAEDIEIETNVIDYVDCYKNMYDNFWKRCKDNTLIEAYGRNNESNAGKLFYLPAAIGLTLGRWMNLGVVPVMLLGRIFMLLATVCLMYWGIRQMPFGKTVMFVIALLPITLQQIMSFSYDATIIGIAYVYVGYCLKWAYTEKKANILEIIAVLGILLMLSTCKGGVYLPITFLALLIPMRRGKFTKKVIFFGTGIFLLILFAYVKQNIGVFVKLTSVQGTVMEGTKELYSLSYFLKYPIELVRIFENTFYKEGDILLCTMLGGRVGQSSWRIELQWILIGSFLILLLLCALRGKEEKQYLCIKDKIWIGFICLGSFGLIMLSMLVSFTPFGNESILGVQGRYFLPFLGLVLLLVRNQQLLYQKKREQIFVFAGCVLEMFAISQILLGI